MGEVIDITAKLAAKKEQALRQEQQYCSRCSIPMSYVGKLEDPVGYMQDLLMCKTCYGFTILLSFA